MAAPNYISFEEIVQGRDASVRITEDKLLYAVDLVIVVTEMDRNNAGRVLRDMKEEIFPSTKIVERSMPGKGNARTRLVTFKNAIELVMVLPGKLAKETRTKFAEILTRYMAGDEGLVREIRANAESASPIAQLARASLDADNEYQITYKRKLDQLELEERMAEVERKRAETKAMLTRTEAESQAMLTRTEAEAKAMLTRTEAEAQSMLKKTEAETQAMLTRTEAETRASNTATLEVQSKLYTSLCPNQIMDERGRILIKDCVLNACANKKLITDGTEPARFVTVSTVASEMGYRFDTGTLIKIGRQVKEAYFKRYGEDPPKHEQIVGGAVRPVCSYQTKDRDLIEAAVRCFAV